MIGTYFYRIPRINNFDDAIPAIYENLERHRPGRLVNFIKANNIQALTPEISFSTAELSNVYDRHHPLLMTFFLAILDRPDNARPILPDWYHDLILQTEERKVSYLTGEQQDKLYELLILIHPEWGNINATTEPFDFPGYLNKYEVKELLELLKDIEFQEDNYKEGAQELITALQAAGSRHRELILECQL